MIDSRVPSDSELEGRIEYDLVTLSIMKNMLGKIDARQRGTFLQDINQLVRHHFILICQLDVHTNETNLCNNLTFMMCEVILYFSYGRSLFILALIPVLPLRKITPLACLPQFVLFIGVILPKIVGHGCKVSPEFLM